MHDAHSSMNNPTAHTYNTTAAAMEVKDAVILHGVENTHFNNSKMMLHHLHVWRGEVVTVILLLVIYVA